MNELGKIAALFHKLKKQPTKTFPARRQKLEAPKEPGVYVIYSPGGKVEHVGESRSIAGRLRGHMGNSSSYVNKIPRPEGSETARGVFFPVRGRQRSAVPDAAAGDDHRPAVSSAHWSSLAATRARPRINRLGISHVPPLASAGASEDERVCVSLGSASWFLPLSVLGWAQ